MTAESAAQPWFHAFVAATLLAAAASAALAAAFVRHRRERRRVLESLGSFGRMHGDAVRGARAAAGEAARLDQSLAELRAILETAPVGMVALDRLGRIVTINPAAERLLVAESRAPVGRLLGELARSDELDALVNSARDSGQRAEAELAFSSAAGRRQAACSVVPLSRGVGEADLLLVLADRTELRRLEAVRTEFVANVSHELRTPITSIRGYAETLAESPELPDGQRAFARKVARGAIRLGAIVDDLLLLSSLEGPAARTELAAMPVRVAGVVAEAVEHCGAAARDKRVKVDTAVDPRLWVSGNAGLLAHAVSNLLSNAIKYGPEDSPVAVTATEDGGWAVICVIDRGPGIPDAHRERLFERFYRVDRARSRDSGGTGLGLAIVKHVAMAHGGTVEVESRTDSRHGSTFRLRLPVADLGGSRTLPLAAGQAPESVPVRSPGRQSA